MRQYFKIFQLCCRRWNIIQDIQEWCCRHWNIIGEIRCSSTGSRVKPRRTGWSRACCCWRLPCQSWDKQGWIDVQLDWPSDSPLIMSMSLYAIMQLPIHLYPPLSIIFDLHETPIFLDVNQWDIPIFKEVNQWWNSIFFEASQQDTPNVK